MREAPVIRGPVFRIDLAPVTSEMSDEVGRGIVASLSKGREHSGSGVNGAGRKLCSVHGKELCLRRKPFDTRFLLAHCNLMGEINKEADGFVELERWVILARIRLQHSPPFC